MLVVSLVAQKGGSGKTTLSVGLACSAVAVGHTAVIIDLDPQATAASWGDRREADAPPVLSVQPPRLGRILEASEAQGVHLAVVDTAPRADQSALAAVKASHLVLIPCRPAIYDLETVLTTIDLVRAARPEVVVRCVLNAVPPRGPRASQAREVLTRAGVETCLAELGHRAVVDHSAVLGLTPVEHDPRGKSAAEFTALYLEMCHLIDLPTSRVVEQ